MTKLMNLNLQNAEILSKDEMKKIAGGGECICTSAIDDLGNPICYDRSTGGRCFNGSGSGATGTCASYGFTGDSWMIVCDVSKAEALDNFNWWNTSDKAWCCDSCAQTTWWHNACRNNNDV